MGYGYETLEQMDMAPAPSWLIDSIILEGGVTVLGAYAKTGKTYLSLEISKSVATGDPLFGIFESKKGSVLIIDRENNKSILKKRRQELGIQSDLPIYYIHDKSVMVDSRPDLDKLKEDIDKLNPSLIIFDTLTRFHKSRENESSEMSVVMGAFKELVRGNRAVLIIHHNRKGEGRSGEKLRGSGDILASIDNLLTLEKRSGIYILGGETGRVVGLEEPVKYRPKTTKTGHIYFEYLGENLTTHKKIRTRAADIAYSILLKGELSKRQIYDHIIKTGVFLGKTVFGEVLDSDKRFEKRATHHNKYLYRIK